MKHVPIRKPKGMELCSKERGMSIDEFMAMPLARGVSSTRRIMTPEELTRPGTQAASRPPRGQRTPGVES